MTLSEVKASILFLLAALVSIAPAMANPIWQQPLDICIDYHCDFRRPVILNDRHRAEIHSLFAAVTSAEMERERLKLAIARLENISGLQTENWRDLPGNDGEGSELGQLDCIAESLNTHTYLRLLQKERLLKWHHILGRKRRGSWFSVHWSAFIRDKTTGQEYSVDSWPEGNGKPPHIQSIDAWMAGEDIE